MADRQFNIEVLIKARNAANAELRNVANQVNGLNQRIAELSKKNEDATKTINELNDEIAGLGKTSKTSGEQADKAFKDLTTRLGQLDNRINEVNRSANKLGDEGVSRVGEKSAKARKEVTNLYVSIEDLAKKLAKANLTPFQQEKIQQQWDETLAKLKKKGEANAAEYGRARLEAERNTNRRVLSERAKLESEVAGAVRNAQRGANQALNESLAKIVDLRNSLKELGDRNTSKTIRESFSLAIGRQGTDTLSGLAKQIQAIGLISKKELAEFERSARATRLAELQGLRDSAQATQNLVKQKQIATDAEIERQHAAEDAARTEAAILKEQERLSEKLTRADRQRTIEHISNLKKQQQFTHALEREFSQLAETSGRAGKDIDKNSNLFSRFADRLLGVSTQTNSASGHLRELALNARGFVLAFVIKYAQALTSALVGLGGEIVSVTASFISAGAAIGGAFTAGILEAIPVIGLLISSITRAAKVLEVLNLKKDIKESSGNTRETDANKTKTAIESITNAQDSLADANRNLARAQEELTDARAEGRRELQDLVLAERAAELAARGAVLSQEEAQRALRAALESGDSAAIARSRLGVQSSRLDVTQRRQDVQRARTDNRQVGGNVEKLDRVITARRQVAEAERRAADATRGLARAQDDLADSAADASSQENRLAFLLAELSPSERDLLNALEKFQDTYKKNFRGITDIIVDSFTEAVDRGTDVLNDNRLLTAARDLATKVAKAFDQLTAFGTGERARGFLAFSSKEAEFNIKSITDTLIDGAKALFSIGEAAAPVFRFLIDTVGDAIDKLEFATRGNKSVGFFEKAEDDLETIVDLLKEVGRFFDIIFNPARKTGTGAIEELTGALENFDRKLEASPKKVQKFFDDAHRIFVAIARVIGALAVEIFKIFNASSVEEFADVIRDIFIPALGTAIRAVGILTRAIQIILDLPVVKEFAQYAFSIFLIQKSISALRGAAASLVSVFAALFGAGSKGSPAANPLVRSFVLIGGGFLTLKNLMDKLNITFEQLEGKIALLGFALGARGLLSNINKSSAAFTAYQAAVATNTAAAGTAVAGFASKSSRALTGLRAAFLANPFGLLVTGISLAASALSLFFGANNKTKNSVEDLTGALERQTDAYRALRDAALDQKDANIAVANAEIRLENAKARQKELAKEIRKDGKITAQEARDEKQGKLDIAQAEIDLTRAKRRSKDVKEDNVKVEERARKESKITLTQAKENVAALKEERDKIKNKIGSLKEQIEITRKSGDKNLEIQATKDLNKEEDKLEKTNKKLKEANGDLRQSLRISGKAFVRLKGNAEDFGLSFSDVLKFMEQGANSALGSFGAKKVNFFTKYTKSETAHIPDFSGDAQGRAQGGFLDGEGLMDTIPVMAAPGEAVINRHQIPFVDTALRASGIMDGGLQELFSRVQTPHYMAGGGFVQGAASTGGGKFLTSAAKAFAKKMFGLGFSVTSAYRPGDPRQHGKGQALDFGDSVNDLRRLWSYVYPIRSQFNQLLGPYGLYNGTKQFENAGLQAQHRDHVHVGFLDKAVAGLKAVTDQIGRTQFKSSAAGFPQRLARAAERKIREAGNKYLAKNIDFDTFDRNVKYDKVKGGLSANQVRQFASRAIGLLGIDRQKSEWIQMLVGRARQESSFNPNAVNRTDINAQRGDPSRGLMQIIGSNFKKYAFRNRLNINNPFDNMLASIAYMLDRYGKGNPNAALAAMQRRNAAVLPYARGGFIKAASGVNTARTQFQSFRSSQITAQSLALGKAKEKASDFVGNFEDAVFGAVKIDINNAIKALRSGDKGKAAKAGRDLTDASEGFLARLINQFSVFSEGLKNRLKSRSLKFSGGKVTKVTTDVEDARGALVNIKKEQDELVEQRKLLLKAERAARKSGNKKLARSIRETRLGIEAQIFDKIQEIQEATDAAFNVQVENINDQSSRILGAIDRARRLRRFTGQRGFAKQEQAALTQQQAQLAETLRQNPGVSPELRAQIQDQIDELGVAILDKASESIKEGIDDVEAQAQRGAARVSRRNRLADLVGRRTAGGGVAAERLRGAALREEGSNLARERLGLQAQLTRAKQLGDQDLINELNEKIADLSVSIEENKVAIQENTDAVQQAIVNSIIDKNSFASSTIGSAIQNLTALGGLAGNSVNNPLIKQLLQTNIGIDNSTIRKLFDQLRPILNQLGISSGGVNPLDPTSLNKFLASLANINTDGLTPADQEIFRTLISTLLGLSGSVIGLTQQMEDLNNAMNPQSFATTAWSLFNQAIFNGEGALLPQFASLVPQMHTGGMVTKSGYFELQAGERVSTENMVNNSNVGNTKHEWYITNPSEVVDPDYLASVLSFKLSTSSAVR